MCLLVPEGTYKKEGAGIDVGLTAAEILQLAKSDTCARFHFPPRQFPVKTLDTPLCQIGGKRVGGQGRAWARVGVKALPLELTSKV